MYELEYSWNVDCTAEKSHSGLWLGRTKATSRTKIILFMCVNWQSCLFDQPDDVQHNWGWQCPLHINSCRLPYHCHHCCAVVATTVASWFHPSPAPIFFLFFFSSLTLYSSFITFVFSRACVPLCIACVTLALFFSTFLTHSLLPAHTTMPHGHQKVGFPSGLTSRVAEVSPVLLGEQQ